MWISWNNMELRDLLADIAILGLFAAICGVSVRSCYDNYHIKTQQQIHREADKPEPTTGQVRFGQYIPRDANSNYDSNSR